MFLLNIFLGLWSIGKHLFTKDRNRRPMFVMTFTEWRVVPEDLVPLSVLSLVCRGRFILEGVLITALVKCFLVRVCGLVK